MLLPRAQGTLFYVKKGVDAMKVTVEDQSSVKKILHIEVEQETVTREIDDAFAELKKTAKVKGFRPGKTPRSVLERMYQKDVFSDVSSKLIQDGFIEALKETGLNVLGMPQVDPPELKANSPYLFDATVEIHPEIPDIDFKGLTLNRSKYEVSDTEVDMQLGLLRQNMARRNKIEEERPVRTGDLAVIDYEGFQNGQTHKETEKTDNFVVKVGDGHVVKDLDDGLVGMTVGEEKDINVEFPESYFNKELAGQQLVFKVRVNEIREEVLPEINDEFARNLSDKFGTLDALKAKIRENLESGYVKRVEQELNEQVFKQLLDKAAFEVPDIMIDAELEHIMRDTEKSFTNNNRTFDELGLSRESLAQQYRPVAEKQVRRHLVLSKLIDQEKLVISDEELDQGMQAMADTYQQPIEQLKSYYDKNSDGLAFFKHTLLEKKALKLILDNSIVTEKEPEKAVQAASESA